MRTNIDIDDDLMQKAMQCTGANTKKATVEAGLRLLLEIEGQSKILKLRGKLKWEGNLHESRLSRFEDRG